MSNQIAQIYKFPSPSLTANPVVAVISFGGGLYGTVSPQGVLTGGDVQTYWTSLGIPAENHPQVIVVPVDGAVNTPNVDDGGSTIENAIDVETIGANCATSRLTILFYLAPNSLAEFPKVLSQAINNTVTVNGVGYKPSIVSVSWGAPETYYSGVELSEINTLLQKATQNGINVCVATGDHGSSDGIVGTRTVDFPSSCAYTIACGGTHLVCPNGVYDDQTVETTWASTGGGISTKFPKPSYQSALTETTGRSTPDIALVADPNTGVEYLIGGQSMIIGGTSIVAPAVAAYLACVNPTYFINPKMYTFPSTCFHDITSGSNGAYAATARYDNCTGFGSLVGDLFAAQIAAAAAPVSVTGVTIFPRTLALQPGQISRVTAMIVPSSATNQALAFTTSNAAVATVVATTGVVTALAIGSATITVTTTDGLKTATSAITVTGPPVAATGVSLLPSALTLTVNQTSQLTATVAPPTATNKTVTYTSSNTATVTVSTTGLVTAVTPGSATITVTTASGGKTANTVVSVVTPVTGVTVNPTTLALNLAQTAQLTPTISPANASNKAVTYTSSSNAVATVNNAGLVTAKGAGSATITTTTVDGTKNASTTVTVTAPPIPVTGVTMTPASLALQPSQTGQLTATVLPPTATNKSVTYTSNNLAVATVGGTGLVTGVGGGNATITVTTASGGLTASSAITVTIPAASVSLAPDAVTLHPTQTSQLTATVSPANASNKAVTYTSSLPAVATVSPSGLVTAVAAGQATVTVTTANGRNTAATSVAVTAPAVAVTRVTLNTNALRLQPGQTVQLQAAVQPPTAANQTVSFSTTNEAVATVDATGLVAAITTGAAIVTATTQDGGKTASAAVTVADGSPTSVTGLTLDVTSLRVRRNRLYAVQAKVEPSTAANKQVRWSSDTPLVATVDTRGVIRTIRPGTAVMTALTVDGGFTATVLVIVF